MLYKLSPFQPISFKWSSLDFIGALTQRRDHQSHENHVLKAVKTYLSNQLPVRRHSVPLNFDGNSTEADVATTEAQITFLMWLAEEIKLYIQLYFVYNYFVSVYSDMFVFWGSNHLTSGIYEDHGYNNTFAKENII